MKRNLMALALALVLVLSLALTGCQKPCEHEWEDANCDTPKTCKLCGETDGQPTDKHQWEEATTDAPKTCSVCHLTEGDPIDVDERFTTSACKPLFGQWQTTYETDGTSLGMAELVIPMKMTITFCKDGELLVETAPQSISALEQEVADLRAELDATKAELEAARAAANRPKTDSELEAYRRAERAERIAAERVAQLYNHANGVLADATHKADDLTTRVCSIADRVVADINELQVALAQGKKTLKDAAAAMYSIRPANPEE